MKHIRTNSFFSRMLNPSQNLNWIGIISVIISFWFLFLPIPYIILFSALVILPLLGIILNWAIKMKGLKYSSRPSIYTLVHVIGRNDGDYLYQLSDYITFPSVVLFIRTLLDYGYNSNIDSYSTLILTTLIVFLFLVLFISVLYRIIFYIPYKRKRVYAEFIIIFLMYSLGLTLGINCVYDKGNPIPTSAIIVDQHTYRSNKRLSYIIDIAKINDPEKIVEIRVSSDFYFQSNIGDTVSLFENQGLLNISWLQVKNQQ